MLRYQLFELLITPDPAEANQYQARVLNSPAGQGSTRFVNPFSGMKSPQFCRRSQLRQPTRPMILTPQQVGERLFNALFSGSLFTLLVSSLALTRKEGTGLRLSLRLNETPELAALPWEYLCGTGEIGFLALSAHTPIVRFPEIMAAIAPVQVQLPLRILAVISAPQDVATLDGAGEWQRIQSALATSIKERKVVVERLHKATLAALRDRLRDLDQPIHCLHFIGHGLFDRQAQQGGLLFEDEARQSVLVSSDLFAAHLSDHRPLSLVFLNACEAAAGGEANYFAGVAQALVQRNLPAVIAMQYAVSDGVSVELAGNFYDAVADGYPIDAALAEARKAVFGAGNSLQWGTPVLFMRSPDGQLFELNHAENRKPQAENATMDEKKTGSDPKDADAIRFEDVLSDSHVGGSVYFATVGAGAENVAVGSDITQILTENAETTNAEDQSAIQSQLQKISAALAATDLEPKRLGAIEARLELLQDELMKLSTDDPADGGTMMKMGDWLMSNAPEIKPQLLELFALPAVAKGIARISESASVWLRTVRSR